ncbi:MAG: class I SAM-dependent methyltransferase [Flavobacteriales bacterium]|nr:class I SAM-dependent methyltransferase [Flavobacteriales bacterium]
MNNKTEYWQKIYATKNTDEVSWYQGTPKSSLNTISGFNLPKGARIMDVGGGDSTLVDHLLAQGYFNISVLDISEKALEKAKARLGMQAKGVEWIVADAATYKPQKKYDLWHDRAAFHFLTNQEDINHYVQTISQFVNPDGYLVMGTFAEDGPEKCSGLPVHRYSETMMTALLRNFFEKIECFTEQHRTPFDTLQHFLYCSFKRLDLAQG